MSGLLAFWHSIDWAAAWAALVVLNTVLLPWLWVRNMALPDMLIRLSHEEKEWLDQHPNCFKGKFKRFDTLPTYGRILLTLWKPLKEFEAELKPIEEYYKEN
jgi:hypothetical protein